ncbi:MAG: M20/M25/M40 family metallo-hydrolase [Gemmatimonadota bacterium]
MSVHPATPELLAWLIARQEDIVRLVEELAHLESPTTEPERQGPVFDLVGNQLLDLGWEVRRLQGETTGGQLYARPPREPLSHRRALPADAPRSAAQLVVGHVDTVWPVGTLEEMPVHREGGRLHGPGVFDMKGGLAQLVFALRALDALELEPELVPVVFLNSDEETGSPESENRIRLLARRCRRALVLEPALGLEGRLKTTRRGGGRFELIVLGKSAHTGLAPGEGASAIHELSHAIQAVYQLADSERDISVNVGEIRGGSRPNVVASSASAVVDVRVRTRRDGRWIEERLQALESADRVTPGTTLQVRGAVDRAPMEGTPRNRRLWEAAREVGESLGIQLEEGMSGGGSDGNTTSLYTATLDGLGAVGDGAHALHEYLEVNLLAERAALLAGLLLLPSGDGLAGSHRGMEDVRAGSAAGEGGP